MNETVWLLTGEYPPDPGGVSDHSRVVAQELAGRGKKVVVWAPGSGGEVEDGAGVWVIRTPAAFSAGFRHALRERLLSDPPDRCLLQYVPQSFGWKGVNLLGVERLASMGLPQLEVIFHEVALPRQKNGGTPYHWAVMVTERMARIMALSAARIWVTIPGWSQVLAEVVGHPIETEWLPVPSNIPDEVRPEWVSRWREKWMAAGACTGGRYIGSFGTFGRAVAPMIEEAFLALNEAGDSCVAIGRGSIEFAGQGSTFATGESEPEDLAAALLACDLMVQPYPDGVSSRRTTAMAALALGRPLVTMRGQWTDPIWEEAAEAEALILTDSIDEMVRTAIVLGADEVRCQKLGHQGRQWYQQHFSPEALVNRLLLQEKP